MHEETDKTPTERICAFYSHGPHYRRLLRYLRQKHPNAQVTALIPPDYPADHIADDVDAVETTAQTGYGLSNPRGFIVLLRQIRRERYDRFVVMFDSPRLRILTALAGARERRCYDVNGRYRILRLGLVHTAASALWRNLHGRAMHAYIGWVVKHRPVEDRREP